ncbi:DUF6503 family protein [Portibacter marinus]|uniref:DUF6503 family protein n=1 Tax=Portibacter marinus TaxID=2898660 RepID=UPI001F30D978|nr:DUF6503 family protein [Portibacter marinus]
MKFLVASILFCSILIFSCTTSEKTQYSDVYENMPDEMEAVLEAHGGLKQWQKMKAMTYEFNRGDKKELHKIDLSNRKVRLEGGNWVIGYDGEEVWVSPDKQAYGGNSARFYHNLIFYFYAMPFVLADPGINYDVMEPAEIKGKTLNRISISYNNDVGDAPDDEYILCYDPDTKKMEWLMYTVTYFSKEKRDQYNALHYSQWKEISGLLLPEKMSGYRTSGDTITEKRYENLFQNVELMQESFDQSIFEMPAEAEIDSLK